MENPFGVVSQLSDGQPFGTHGPVADWRCRISLYSDHPSIFDVGDHTASTMTASADCLYLSDFFHRFLLAILPVQYSLLGVWGQRFRKLDHQGIVQKQLGVLMRVFQAKSILL
jgi:hypothetical protein